MKSLPYKLSPSEFESIVDSLEDAKLICYGHEDVVDGIESAILLARRDFLRSYKDQVLRYWRIFDANLWNYDNFLEDHVFVSNIWNLCVRKYNDAYYAIQIADGSSIWGGVLTTDCPDNYPMHSFPGSIISVKYPEIAMVKVILAKEAEEVANNG